MNTKQRNRNWMFNEIKCLIRIWGKNYLDLTSVKRNRKVYEKMAEQLRQFGYVRSHAEIQNKIKNLNSEYRAEVHRHGCTETGFSPSEWPHFVDVHNVIGVSHHQANPSTLESFTSQDLEQSPAMSDMEQLMSITDSKEREMTTTMESASEEQNINSSRIPTVKEELVENEELESPIVSNPETILPCSNPETSLTTVSTTTVYNPQRPPQQRPKLTFYPVISKVAPPKSNEKSQSKEDEELDLYLKLLGNKLRQYRGLERRQIMHEIDGVFLRITPSLPSSSTAPQFVIASFGPVASSSQSKSS